MDKLPLTKRQIEILELIQAGCSNKEVARRLDISDGTVKQHLVEIFRRLKVNNRTKAAQMVNRATAETFFLSPLQQQDVMAGAGQAEAVLSTASVQPMHCLRIRPLSSGRELLHRLGAERFTRLNRVLRDACERVAQRFEGVIQGSIEGPLVLFGVRHVREDDPLRAVCAAGLLVQELARELSDWEFEQPPFTLTIYSVQVVSSSDGKTTTIQGELTIPESEASDTVALGSGIVLSPATARAVDRLFARHGKPSVLLPGCFMLVGHGRIVEFPDPEPTFVGRDIELEEMQRRLSLALNRSSESTLLVGEAGFGETRLVRQLIRETQGRKEVRWLQGACHTVMRMVPLHPFLPVVEQLAGCDGIADHGQRWMQLENWLRSLPQVLQRGGQLFLHLVRELQPLPRLQPGDSQYEELLRFLVGIMPASTGAVVLYLDNLQWMDNWSRVVLSGLAGRLARSHVWLLGVGRKAELRALANQPDWHVLSLLRLPNREILRLLKQMPVARRLDALQIDLLLEWSRGVPLFAVEIANHLARMKKTTLQETIRAHDLFPEALSCMVMERLNALVAVDWKVIRALASSEQEVPMEQYHAWNLHGDFQASEAAVTALYQAGVLKITERGARRFVSFGNEMVRAAIRKTLPESDLTP